ncbi:MAG: class I SAM-dependent methyltransferase [Anaerolineales bacterium]|jgi:SAM-dependent methyltransferase
MSVGDYEYRGLVARSWDFLRGDTSNFPDREFYRDIIEQSGEPVLIVGCGTGRLLLEYVDGGTDVEGMDNSPEMLEICQQKAAQQALEVTVYKQAMEAMDLPRRYKTIILPSSSFQLVPDLDEAKNALDGFFQHLLPGGTLVMSFWHIQSEGTGEWGDWRLIAEGEGFGDGKGIRRWERAMYDSSTQLRHTESRYELVENGEVVFTEMHRRSPELRNYSLSQLTVLLEESGYAGVYAVSGFSKEPASEDDEVFCILGKKI